LIFKQLKIWKIFIQVKITITKKKKEINNLIKIIYSNLVNSSLFDRVAQELIKKLHNKSNFYEYNL